MPILSTGTRWNYQFRRVPFFYSLVIWYIYYNAIFRFIIDILPNLFNQYTNYTKKAPLCAGLFGIYKLYSQDCECWIVFLMSSVLFQSDSRQALTACFALFLVCFELRYPTSFIGSILMFVLITFLNNIRRSSSIGMLFYD